MKKLIASLLVMFCLIGCSQKKENSLPAPVSKGDLQKLIAGKTFTVSRIGTISPFASGLDKEEPYRWFDEEKEQNDFAEKYQSEREKFVLQFMNDTLVKITDDGKIWDAAYKIDEEVKDEEKAGMKFQFTYPDTDGTMSFPGTTEPMVLTSTYFVAGIKDNTMIVETPRQFNRSTVVLWMKVK
ncbi:MAG: hypothetical protein IPH34_06980 [Chitinophagaceae bacterium]|nr:hypothetical protein [Chitinophagaceae bacterium]MBP6477546.1 hypothetical protein [Chitinophagaceae bacterium]MBP7109352.1 hypothetical protein [Chitinophagaceae bacterium]